MASFSSFSKRSPQPNYNHPIHCIFQPILRPQFSNSKHLSSFFTLLLFIWARKKLYLGAKKVSEPELLIRLFLLFFLWPCGRLDFESSSAVGDPPRYCFCFEEKFISKFPNRNFQKVKHWSSTNEQSDATQRKNLKSANEKLGNPQIIPKQKKIVKFLIHKYFRFFSNYKFLFVGFRIFVSLLNFAHWNCGAKVTFWFTQI